MDEFRKLTIMEGLTSTRQLCHLVDDLANVGPASIRLLLGALHHDDSIVRGHAAAVLGEFHLPRKDVAQALQQASDDTNDDVRHAATLALSRINTLSNQSQSSAP